MAIVSEYFFPSSNGKTLIHVHQWTPVGREIRGVVQIAHGVAEYAARYTPFARYLCDHGFVVVANDHLGHGQSVIEGCPMVYLGEQDGWWHMVDDMEQLRKRTAKVFSGKPYFLFGHSMGSFMARTILAKYPASGISGAVICGTAWMPGAVIGAGKLLADTICKMSGEQKPSKLLQVMMFGSYNKKIEHPRTHCDWLSRDRKIVDTYVADPLCGFIPSAGLVRSMMEGLQCIQNEKNLDAMRKDLPVFFIAGGDDPVGGYGAGVQRAVEEFKKHGMERVSLKIYPLGRHEILNEINCREVHEDVANWIERII